MTLPATSPATPLPAPSRPGWLAYLALAAGIVATGFSAVFVTWAGAPGPVAGFYRMTVALLLLAWPFYRQRRLSGRRPISRRLLGTALLGGLFFAGDVAFWNSGVLLSGATSPTIMANTAPLWVGLGAFFFFRERLSRLFWMGLLLASAGAVLILGLDAWRELALGLGTLMGAASGLFYGSYFLVTQHGRQELDTLSYFWIAAASSTVVLLAASLLLGMPLLGYSAGSYLNMVALGLVSQLLGQFSFSYALGYLPASFVAPAALLQPVITALLADRWLHQPLTAWQVAGGAIVLAGIYLVQRSRQQPASPPTPPRPTLPARPSPLRPGSGPSL